MKPGKFFDFTTIKTKNYLYRKILSAELYSDPDGPDIYYDIIFTPELATNISNYQNQKFNKERLAGMKDKVRRYLGLCLFSQAGVTLGLAYKVYEIFNELGGPASLIGFKILSVVVASTLIAQLIGPIGVKYAIFKAEEAGKKTVNYSGYMKGSIS